MAGRARRSSPGSAAGRSGPESRGTGTEGADISPVAFVTQPFGDGGQMALPLAGVHQHRMAAHLGNPLGHLDLDLDTAFGPGRQGHEVTGIHLDKTLLDHLDVS